ncbi:ankyrin repeat domain-containing protein 50 [Elysia marginata]|uniref:Ankyrin repeat domain-containing protein 50 n=1 Tax=Elysia marginata TaxID=1093978 RepID=A0AAV4H4Z0_9GAST|nr:ankyrin repeat domain-containing protein 50 [Elysia marginata]
MEKLGLPPPPIKRLIKTALHQAVLDERLHQVRLLVDKHRVCTDTKDVHGRTPLMLSCIIDNQQLGYRMAHILLKAGAYLNLRDGMGRTALSYACMNGRENIVALLLKEDVLDINEPDNDGNTPLHHAATCGNPRIVEMLAQAFHKFGLNADRRNNLGYTALLLACKSGHYVSAHILLTVAKASPTLRDGEFHLNAAEWTRRRHQHQNRLTDRSQLASAMFRDHCTHKCGPFLTPPIMSPLTHTYLTNFYFIHKPSTRSPQIAPAATPRPLAALSFEREDSMYQRPWVPICRLQRVPNPHYQAATIVDYSGFRLPELGGTGTTSLIGCNDVTRSEVFLDGLEARQVLLNEIEDSESKTRPISTKTTVSRWIHPPTAKLRAVSRPSRSHTSASVPDIVAMFKMYCEQYQPDWRLLDRQRRKTFMADTMTGVVPVSASASLGGNHTEPVPGPDPVEVSG